MTKPEQLVNAPTAYHSVTNLADLQPPTQHLEPRIITDTPGTIEVDQEQPTLRDRIRRAGRGMLQGAGIAVTMGSVLATVWFGYKAMAHDTAATALLETQDNIKRESFDSYMQDYQTQLDLAEKNRELIFWPALASCLGGLMIIGSKVGREKADPAPQTPRNKRS